MEKSNRLHTADELEFACQMLETLDATAQICLINLSRATDDDFPVLVVQDFGNTGDASILLVPEGAYEIDYDNLPNVSHIIGLNHDSAQYPVLDIQADDSDVINSDSGEIIPLKRINTTIVHANVRIESEKNIVLETFFFDDKQFSDVFFNVQLGHHVDILSTYSNVLYHGRDWALAAYGSCYRGRNTLEKGLDKVHRGMFNTVDTIFRPLSQLGTKLDKILNRGST